MITVVISLISFSVCSTADAVHTAVQPSREAAAAEMVCVVYRQDEEEDYS